MFYTMGVLSICHCNVAIERDIMDRRKFKKTFIRGSLYRKSNQRHEMYCSIRGKWWTWTVDISSNCIFLFFYFDTNILKIGMVSCILWMINVWFTNELWKINLNYNWFMYMVYCVNNVWFLNDIQISF